jgi:hypothetical protein
LLTLWKSFHQFFAKWLNDYKEEGTWDCRVEDCITTYQNSCQLADCDRTK